MEKQNFIANLNLNLSELLALKDIIKEKKEYYHSKESDFGENDFFKRNSYQYRKFSKLYTKIEEILPAEVKNIEKIGV